MPAKFSLSFSARWNLARSRRNNFPASSVFSQLESSNGVNLPCTLSRTPAEFHRAVRHRTLRRHKTESLDPNFQQQRQARTTEHRTLRRPHPRRVRTLLPKRRCHYDPPPYSFPFPNFSEYRTPLISPLDWPKTTNHA
jgi:hypothetical protein